MDGFNVGKILAGLTNPELYIKRLKQDGVNQNNNSFNSTFTQAGQNNILNNPINNLILNNQLQMNQLANMDRAVYVRNLLGLPQTLGEILRLAQSKIPLSTNILLPNMINEDMVTSQKVLS